MKFLFVLGAATIVGPLFVATATPGIEGSKHDFSSKEWSGGDACTACHTQEKNEPPSAAPLWDAKADLNRRFGTSLAQSNAAGGGTTLCLRCHDGTIAMDAIAPVKTIRRPVSHLNPSSFSTGHGKGNHPVGVEYPAFDRGYEPSNLVIANRVVLPDGRVECISCHDPHNMMGERAMLVRSNARSALCLTCHRK